MDAKRGLAAILRDARKGALLRMRNLERRDERILSEQFSY
jgi:hypothetical protein